MAEAIYILCSMTCLLCAILLFKSYKRSSSKLLFWAAICFVAFTANNVLLFVDKVIVLGTDLSVLRVSVASFGVCALLFGMIQETT